jgi:multiple sugar transport system substrate-binding protein
MMVRYLKTFTAVFLVLLFIVLSGCSRGEVQSGDLPPGYKANVAGHISVTYFLAADDESKLSLSYFAQAFQDRYKDATVNLDFSTGDNRDARIASGDIGDVFFCWEDEIYRYAVENKVLMPLSAYLEVLDIDISNVYSGIYDLGVADGQLYMAARDHTHIVLFYNATALQEVGLDTPPEDWTWDQFKEYCRQLAREEDDNTITRVGAGWDVTYGPHLIPFLEGWGGKWYDQVNKRVSFVTDEKVLEGFSEQIKAMEEFLLMPLGSSSSVAISSRYKVMNEDVVFQAGVFPGLHNTGLKYEVKGLDWNIANWPRFPTHRVGTGATGFAVYNRTKRPDTAAAFALFLFTDEGQRAYNGQTGGSVPLTKNLSQEGFWRQPYDPDEVNYDAFVSFPEADTVGKFHCRVPNSVANIITQRMLNVFVRHFNGSQSYYDSLKEIEQMANEKWQELFENEARP